MEANERYTRRHQRAVGSTRNETMRPEQKASSSTAHHRRAQSSSSLGVSPSSIPSTTKTDVFASQFFMSMTVAGVASGVLVTLFGLFHVDVFLVAYQLPLASYGFGNLIFAVINTCNDFIGAWWLDSYSASHHGNRSDLIAVSGALFSLAFLTPFLRPWNHPSTAPWDTMHFITTISLYDTMYSFTAILLGSLVTDNHVMNDPERVSFMASGKVANMIANFLVARVGLACFDSKNLHHFRTFLVVVALLTALLFLVAQGMTIYTMDWNHLRLHKFEAMKKTDRAAVDAIHPSQSNNSKRNDSRSASMSFVGDRALQLKQVFRDFWKHDNFWAWIGMEVFLEAQVSFAGAFLKTFMDRLVFDEGAVSRKTCDWLLSSIRPLGSVLGILCYIPIRRIGYQRMYSILFRINACLCMGMVLFATPHSTNLIMAFLVVYPTFSMAVMSSGFHLAMSDMVLEMKQMHAGEGRFDEPSLAAMFMGMNALFCKPAESVLPVIAARMLGTQGDLTTGRSYDGVQDALFQVLIYPPLVFSVLKWMSWRRYSLTSHKTHQMREELKRLRLSNQVVDDLHII